MTTIEYIKNWLENSGLMADFTGDHYDYNEERPDEYGLFSTGVSLTGEDIIGNQQYQNTFTLFSGLQAYTDYDRLKNSDFLTKLSYSMNQIQEQAISETVNNVVKSGIITKVRTDNAMLYDVPTGDINDGVIYQLQIKVDYTIKE